MSFLTAIAVEPLQEARREKQRAQALLFLKGALLTENLSYTLFELGLRQPGLQQRVAAARQSWPCRDGLAARLRAVTGRHQNRQTSRVHQCPIRFGLLVNALYRIACEALIPVEALQQIVGAVPGHGQTPRPLPDQRGMQEAVAAGSIHQITAGLFKRPYHTLSALSVCF